jgi:DUF917 family protein
MSATFLRDDLDWLMKGACFLASGGGGPIDLAKEIKEEILNGPNPIEMVDLKDVKQDEELCMVAGVGAPTAEAKFKDSPLSAFSALERETKKQFKYVIPVETGAVNSLLPLLVVTRSEKKIRLVNADGGGRAFPQLKMSSFALNKISCNPAAVATENPQKEPAIFHIDDPQGLEDTLRGGSGPSALATFRMNGVDLKGQDCCVPSALQNAIDVGMVLKISSYEERNAKIQKILRRKVTPLLIKGKIKKLCLIPDPCFDVGTVTVSGEGPSHIPCTIKIFFVNENLAIQVGQEPLVMAPRMFCYLTTDGVPFSNAELIKDWHRFENAEITLTLIEPAAAIDVDDERQYFKDLYETYFKNQS